jgi:hypothetical protein
MLQGKFLSRKETAEFLRAQGLPIKAGTLECLATRGGGPPYHRFGRRAVYDPAEVLAWANARVTIAAETASEHRVQEAV